MGYCLKAELQVMVVGIVIMDGVVSRQACIGNIKLSQMALSHRDILMSSQAAVDQKQGSSVVWEMWNGVSFVKYRL